MLFRSVIEEDGEEILATVDNEEEQQKVYEYYMTVLFDESEGEDESE